jgi:hypothetical protein
MNASHLKQIKDHPDTWDFINLINKNKLVKNPEKITAQMIFNKDNKLYTENKALFEQQRRASADGNSVDARSTHLSQTPSPHKSQSRSPQRDGNSSTFRNLTISKLKGMFDDSSFVLASSPTINKDSQLFDSVTNRTRTSDQMIAELNNEGDYWPTV